MKFPQIIQSKSTGHFTNQHRFSSTYQILLFRLSDSVINITCIDCKLNIKFICLLKSVFHLSKYLFPFTLVSQSGKECVCVCVCGYRVIFLLCNYFIELKLRLSVTKLVFMYIINSLHKGM